jgi:Na+-driven multidrug efflux pump
MQSQNEMIKPTIANAIVFMANIPLNYIFADTVGFAGLAIATSVARWVGLVCMASMVAHHIATRHRAHFIEYMNTSGKFWETMKQYVWLAAPGGAMSMLEASSLILLYVIHLGDSNINIYSCGKSSGPRKHAVDKTRGHVCGDGRHAVSVCADYPTLACKEPRG